MPLGRLGLPQVPSVPRPAIDPFVNATWQVGIFNFVKLATIGLILAPVKFLLGVLGVIVSFLVVRLATLGANLDRPLPPWRRALVSLVTVPARFVLWTLGVWYVEEHGRPDPNVRMIVSNHLSFIEPVYFVSRLAPSFLSKRENIKIPFIGTLMQGIQVLWVDRNDKDSRLSSSRLIEQRMSEAGWPPLILFPEGTCGNGRALMQFRGGGAFAPGRAVQPVVIRYPHLFCDPSFGPGVPGLALLYRVLAQPFVPLRVDWLPVHEPTAAERQNPLLFATNVRAEMAAALNVPTTEHTYDDVRLAVLAERAGLKPWFTAQFELFHVKRALGNNAEISDEMCLSLLRDYARSDREQGWMCLSQWRAGQALPDSPLVDELFTALDIESTGRLSVRTFFVGLLFLSRHFANAAPHALFPRFVGADGRVTQKSFNDGLEALGLPDAPALWRRLVGHNKQGKHEQQQQQEELLNSKEALLTEKQWNDALVSSPSLFVLFSALASTAVASQ